MKQLLIIIFILIAGGAKGYTKDFDYSHIAPHPRLLLKEGEERNIHIALQKSTVLQAFHKRILDYCDETLKEAPVKRIKEGKRLLGVSRIVLKRVFYLSYAYRMTGEKEYLRRAEKEMLAAASFIDWNPSHFLDVSEMSMGLAIGYDWLFNELLPDSRKKIRQAIVEKAIEASKTKHASFYQSRTNWNQVCNGGLVCAALASYENNPSEAKDMIEKALESNKPALEVMYSPDGNYPEGSGYWCYGTLYQVLMLAALNSTLGTDNGLSDTPGFSKTAEYMLYMTGLNSKFFNYSDCAPSSTAALASWWFADKYSNPSLLYNELKMLKNGEYASCAENRLLPMIMAFANNLNLDAISAPSNKLWSGKGETPVVMVHTDWTYTDTDKYLGIKGGKAGSSHGHMDAGSFVYDAYGVRWSMDFGLQSYTTLESVLAGLGGNLWDMGQNSMRWDVFRLNNLNHSTISINDARHRVNGAATLTTTINTATELGATFDLTEVVSDQAASATRTVKIVNDKDLVVMDEIKARTDKSAKVRWCMVTPAVPTVESNRIVLTNGSKVMYLTASGSVKPTYKQWSTTSENFYDQANPGTYMVGFEATVTANQTATFTTTLSPK